MPHQAASPPLVTGGGPRVRQSSGATPSSPTAAGPRTTPNEHAVLTASRLLDDIAEHVRQTMWQAMRAAQGESPATSPSPSNDLVHAGDQLACWAARHDTERSARGIGL